MSDTPRYVVNLTKFKDNCYDIINPFEKEWGLIYSSDIQKKLTEIKN